MRLVALLLLALLAAPTALAHLQGARPVYQRSELDRTVGLDPDGLVVNVDLYTKGDPLRQVVRHELDPARGRFFVEHREDGSKPGERFYAQWEVERLLEYRDANLDGQWQPGVDTPVKVWRLSHYQWTIAAIQNVQVADVRGQSIVWEANLTGAPDLRLEIVATGLDFTDEGAFVRPQDLAFYFDVTSLPPRDIGSLYALELRARYQDGSDATLHRVDDTPTALLVQGERRRALFLWGGETTLDGFERLVNATLEQERADDRGNRTALLTMHIPPAASEMRFVLVSGVEYLIDVKRGTPLPAAPLLLGTLGAAALLLARRGRTESPQ